MTEPQLTDPKPLNLDNHINLEICTGDPDGILAAKEGGADRIELCSGLAEGGLTPSLATIEFATAQIPTNVLIRPRGGDFVYSPAEIAVMERDIEAAVAADASGVVVGALTPDGKVDSEACSRLLAKGAGLDNTFHRAFDVVADPFEALETIISLGFKRILTSGQAATALQGADLIAALRRRAAGRILIMAGAGISPANAVEILRNTGADELHASARKPRKAAMDYSVHTAMGAADADDGSRMATDRDTVAAIRHGIDDFSRLR
ncbi:MAG: copper homeostasis protein CutC [Muribaculaceae bacterium]|nr:copper homeostasis protein CutC [Muribaculaceae bacterium]